MRKTIYSSKEDHSSFFKPENFKRYMETFPGAEIVQIISKRKNTIISMDQFYHIGPDGVTLYHTFWVPTGIDVHLCGEEKDVGKIEEKILKDAKIN